MGSYTFKWENPAGDVSDVLVTGSFDGWTKSVKLEKKGTSFQKAVTFAEKDASSKIYYKFVVDNNWTINESYPHEADHEGNVNNFLTPDDLSSTTSAPVPALAAAPFINTVTPESTTVAEMAKKNNKKKAAAANKPPAAAAASAAAAAPASEAKPETNVAEAASAIDAPVAAEAAPTPSDVPGGFPVTPSNEPADLENKPVSINPLPATAPGTSNPIKLAPGEKIPESIAAQNINEHVKLDKESYERSDALPGGPPFSTTEIPPKSGTMIPESSLPMGDQTDVTNVTISSVGPGSTTAALAGQVPLEPKAPKPSVPTGDQRDVTISSVGPGSTTAALAGQVPLEPKAPKPSVPTGDQRDVTISSVGPGSTTAALAGQVPLEPKVPEVVKESQEKAGTAPEASGVAEEVKDKAKVEEEIKSKVPEAPATSVGTSGIGTEKKENTATILGAATATGAAAVAAAVAAVNKFSEDATPAVNDAKKATVDTINNNLPDTVKDKLPESAQAALASDKKDSPLGKISPQVPKEVKESIAEAGKSQSPEAAVSTSAVAEKKEVESELLKEVKKAPALDEAAKPTETTAPKTKASETKAPETKVPETKAADAAAAATSTQAPATVAAANGATGAETKSSGPTAATPATPATNGNATESKPAAEGSAVHDKKKSRLSVMFNKFKAKLSK